MLPGFRFLVATVVFAAAVLVFGLGAAALLRTAHEEFATLAAANLPAPRLAPSSAATQGKARPTLALLRIETPDLPPPDPLRGMAVVPDAKPVILAQDDDAGADAPPPAMDAEPPADASAAEGAVAGADADPAESLENDVNAGAAGMQTPDLQTGDAPAMDLQGAAPHSVDDNASGGSSSDAGPVIAQPTRMASSHAEEQATAAVTQPVKSAVTVGKRTSTRAMTQRRLHLVRARAAARSRALPQQPSSDPLAQFFGGGRNITSDPRS